MQKIQNTPRFTTLEVCLAFFVLLFAGAFIGSVFTFSLDRQLQVWPAVSAVGSIIGVSLAFLALKTSQGALLESQRANRRGYDMFVLDYRPWLSAEVEITRSIEKGGEIYTRENGEITTHDLWSVRADVIVSNHGKRPATNVQVYTQLLAHNSQLPQASQMRDFAKDYLGHDNSVGPVIFPASQHRFENKGGSILAEDAVIRNELGHAGVPILVGCIIYDGSATDERLQTRFMFFLDETSGTPYETWSSDWLAGAWRVRIPGFTEI